MSFPWANQYQPKNPVMRWVDERLPLPRLVYNEIGAGYPVPRNLNHFWNFGVLVGLAMTIPYVTGIFLAMYYDSNWDLAFFTVEPILRALHAGSLARLVDATRP